MPRRITPKNIPVTPSFTAWQKAADRLLALETALAHHRRSSIPLESNVAELQAAATELRLIADALYEVAFAEFKLAREQSVRRAARGQCARALASDKPGWQGSHQHTA